MNLEKSEEGYIGGFGGRAGKKEMLWLYYNLNIKVKNKTTVNFATLSYFHGRFLSGSWFI